MKNEDVMSLADLAAILTAAGVSVYVLGLTGIYISIRRSLLRNASTAWYVASLLPRTVVAGQGVRIWLGFPLILTVVVLLTILVIAAVRPAWLAENAIWVLGAFAAPVAYFSSMFPFLREVGSGRPLGWLMRLVVFAVPQIGNILLISAGVLFSEALGGDLSGPLDDWIIPVQNEFLVGGVLLFVGAFFIGVPLAATIDPPFPRVRIANRNGGDISELLPGLRETQLIAHSDGFWHLFDDKDKELVSIPDDQMLAVRIPPKEEDSGARKMELLFLLVSVIGFAPPVVGQAVWGIQGLILSTLVGLLGIGTVFILVRKRTRHYRQDKRGGKE